MACRLYGFILYKRDLSALSAVHGIERKSYESPNAHRTSSLMPRSLSGQPIPEQGELEKP